MLNFAIIFNLLRKYLKIWQNKFWYLWMLGTLLRRILFWKIIVVHTLKLLRFLKGHLASWLAVWCFFFHRGFKLAKMQIAFSSVGHENRCFLNLYPDFFFTSQWDDYKLHIFFSIFPSLFTQFFLVLCFFLQLTFFYCYYFKNNF